MRALFWVLLPLIEGIYLGGLLKGIWTVHLVAGGDEDDNIWTVSSDTYVPLANDSDHGDTCEHLFH